MVAIPDRGYAFRNWNPVVVFTFVDYVDHPAGGLTTVVSTVASPRCKIEQPGTANGWV